MAPSGNIEALLAPRNVVLVGASDRNWSPRIWQNLQRFGFPGSVLPVNPGRTEIWGARCHASLQDLPEAPDHLALFVPHDQALDILEAGGRLGVRSATIYAAGFSESTDPAAAARTQRLREILHRFGIAATGPNCMGLAVGRSRFCTFPDEHLEPLADGGVAAITQSGMLGQTYSRGIVDAGLDLAYLISCGNQTGLTFANYIAHLADDPALRVITCYVESVVDGRAFLSASRKAIAAGKNIVVVKAGGSEEARKATLAHTGSLAGRTEVFDAFARDIGVIRVDNLEDMVEASAYLARMPRPRGRNICVMTNSGALKSLMTEAAEPLVMKFPEFSGETPARLKKALPEADATNPFDTKRTVTVDEYMGCVRALHDDPGIDLLLLAEELPREAGIERKIRNLKALNDFVASEAKKPVAVFSPLTFRETDYMIGLRRELSAFPWLRDVGKTFRTLGRIFDAQPGSVRTQAVSEVPTAIIDEIRAQAARLTAPRALSETESKKLLAAYGIPLPREELATGVGMAVEAARRIGFPVVLKAVSAQVPHKSDAGLVFLNLQSADDVHVAAQTVAARCTALGAALDGFLLAQQVSGGTEMVLGVSRDAEMGPAVMVGMGGIWLELFKDVAFCPPDLDVAMARQAISRLRAAKLLKGYRGSSPGSADALAQAMVALGRMARDLGDVLAEVDINPITVLPEGQGVVALDGLVVLQPPDTGGL